MVDGVDDGDWENGIFHASWYISRQSGQGEYLNKCRYYTFYLLDDAFDMFFGAFNLLSQVSCSTLEI